MAAGIPVVATTVGLGGLRAVPGEHLLVADTPYDSTDAILQIFHNPSLRQNLVCKARELVKDFTRGKPRFRHWMTSISP